MIQNFDNYDPKKDTMNIEEVIPDLAIDIEEAIITGTIKDTGCDMTYSEETNVENVGHYIKEPLEMVQAQLDLGASLANIASNGVVDSNVKPDSGE